MIQLSTPDDLAGILALQRANLAAVLPEAEISQQGFVTVQHTPEILRQLHDIEPHVIARLDGQVAAYLLAMTVASRTVLPVLVPMFEVFDRLNYRGRQVSDYRYLVVGQVCVDKAHRGKGLLDACYQFYRTHFSKKYDFAITEIAATNQRSLRAHARIGFEAIERYTGPDGVEWVIVVWDWMD